MTSPNPCSCAASAPGSAATGLAAVRAPGPALRLTPRLLSRAGRRLAAFLIRLYQLAVSPLLGANCRFYPSCSSYALQAIERFGCLRGGWLSLKRIGRCHPWHPGGVDLVPEHTHD